VAPAAGTWTLCSARLERTVGRKRPARQDAQKYMFPSVNRLGNRDDQIHERTANDDSSIGKYLVSTAPRIIREANV
jgi:hypothetical protein